MESRQFDFYGVRVSVRSFDRELLGELEKDFGFFLRKTMASGTKIDIDLECRTEPPPTDLPDLTSRWISPRCTVYRDAESDDKWISYYAGQALLQWNNREDRGILWCEKPELTHELAYLVVLSRVGERWDRIGLHRLHAAALSWDHQALLLILPSGGGKTTFALSALENSGLRLLSDDMPVIDRRGHVLAFPNRIGCCEEPQLDIPRNFVRIFLRQEHGVKWLIDTEAFAGRVSPRALPGWIFVGSRKLHGSPRIAPLSYWETWKELFRSGVVGVGLPQVVELFLNASWRDILPKARIVFSRSWAMFRLMLKSKNFSFELSRSKEDNLQCFLQFLDRQAIDEAVANLPVPTLT